MINYLIQKEQDKEAEFQMPISKSIIGEFDKINVFVGKNNSGKSYFIRSFISKSNQYVNYEINENEINEIKSFLINEFIGIKNNSGRNRKTLNEISLFIEKLKTIQLDNYNFFNFLGAFLSFPDVNPYNILILDNPSYNQQIKNIKSTLNKILNSLNKNHYQKKFIYIPILRGLRPINIEDINLDTVKFDNTDSFFHRTENDYNLKDAKTEIFTGLSIFEEIKRMLLGEVEERQIISDFQDFLKDEIFNDDVTLIPKYKSDVLHIKIGKQRQIEIFKLGDGLQTIITILFPIFINKQNEMYFFIEEPETHLHPAWQSKLLNTLKKSIFDKHQFFLTTHSTAFINEADTRVFSVKKQDDIIKVEQADKKIKSNLIQDLGYKPSDLMLANYVLWVEGPSDKIYLKYLIEKIEPTLKEGLHYSIMILGGDNKDYILSNDDEFDFSLLESLNPNFGIILDSDKKNKSEEVDAKKITLKEKLKSDKLFCWITNKREIENYIPKETFIKAVEKYHQKTGISIRSGDFENRCRIKQTEGEKDHFKIRKIPVARKVVEIGFNIEEGELKEKMEELVDRIKQVNDIN